MVSPINGSSLRVIPTASRLDAGLQPVAAAAGSPKLASPSAQLGLAQQGSPVLAGSGPSRPNIALLEAMQAGRQTSALLSSLMGPDDSFFTAPSPLATMPQGQSSPQRPNFALLQTVQAGRQSSALLSSLRGPGDNFFPALSPLATMPQGQSPSQRSNFALQQTMQAGSGTSALLSTIMGPAAGVRSNDFPMTTRTQGNAVFANPQAALTNAEDIIRATGTGQPWIQDSRVAHVAYLMEIQAQRQVDQRSMGSNLMHEWFG